MAANYVTTVLGKTVITLSVLSCFAAAPCVAREMAAEDSGFLTPDQKVVVFNAVAVGGVLTYGAIMWEYGENSPHVRSEGWFGSGTKHGGADKTGHLYTGYFMGRMSSGVFKKWGYGDGEAALLGAGTSLIFTTCMEIGDSFSDFGLSPQDIYSNILGASAGYLLERYPEAGEFLDLRVEYTPSLTKVSRDPTTDYEHLKYLLAFKLSGFDSLEDSPLRFVEFLGGYYTRNFMGHGGTDDKERNLFVGVGLNLSEVFSETPAPKAFNYLQIPYTYVKDEKTLRN
ncbi:DUF2279 domain-containing protein [bacterium]|nr:MAG: DUF2279 domain-containing protein [bacterium]